jgi:magnesium and cobalt transporter
MNDQSSGPSNGPVRRSWLDRLSQALSGEPRDQQQLIELLHQYQAKELFDADALSMIEGVLNVSEMQVRDIMIPRGQMVVLEHDDPVEKMIGIITASGHSRFPVIGESRDEILGILLAKDLLNHVAAGDGTSFDLNDYLRPAVFIPESKRLNVLLKEFRSSRNHMAMVVDEYGGVAGLVTIEDVLEQIVGEIGDEHDLEEEVDIRQHGANRYTVRALTNIEDFNRFFNADLPDAEVDTIGGLVMHTLGHLPKRGETATIDRFQFKVLSADKRRIYLLQMIRLPEPQAEEPALH